ncbi:hypothetical protein [Paraconexibacter sp. AEG42_29]|uniref:hypothetical protein n=1 Tax=Paraconexibacter sp. AEG42_29 TaxID=2997339 RepID=UPI00339D66B6
MSLWRAFRPRDKAATIPRQSRAAVLQAPEAWPADWAGFESDWVAPGDAEKLASALDDELRRELKRGHELFDRDLLAIAKRDANDDVLFADPASPEVFVVHLTWSGHGTPPWPKTTAYATFGHFLQRALVD